MGLFLFKVSEMFLVAEQMNKQQTLSADPFCPLTVSSNIFSLSNAFFFNAVKSNEYELNINAYGLSEKTFVLILVLLISARTDLI